MREFLPNAPDNGGLLGYDEEFARADELAAGIASAVVAQRIVTAVAATFEEASLDACHALRVEVALELRGDPHVVPGSLSDLRRERRRPRSSNLF
jgi:hypothetical protein